MNWALDNYNYACDERTKGPAPDRVTVWIGEDEIELPTKYEVCPVCRGEGKHVNPSIDAGGLSMNEFYDDPDFAEDYFGGTYDVTCNRCRGKRVVKAADWDALTSEQREALKAQERADWEYEQERLSEIRMGC